MQRDRRRDAGVLVYLGGVGDLLVRITRHARLGEHLEPCPGVAEGPGRQLDLLLAQDALDTLTIHSGEPAFPAIAGDGVMARGSHLSPLRMRSAARRLRMPR